MMRRAVRKSQGDWGGENEGGGVGVGFMGSVLLF